MSFPHSQETGQSALSVVTEKEAGLEAGYIGSDGELDSCETNQVHHEKLLLN